MPAIEPLQPAPELTGAPEYHQTRIARDDPEHAKQRRGAIVEPAGESAEALHRAGHECFVGGIGEPEQRMKGGRGAGLADDGALHESAAIGVPEGADRVDPIAP